MNIHASATPSSGSSFPSILGFLGFKKRTQEWGTVYDSVTKQPLDPVYVIVYDMLGREIATSITDLDGRYGFILQPGLYRIAVQKTNYEFPSKRLIGKESDEVYSNLYFGENVLITVAEQVISKNIPMDPVGADWNEAEKRRRNLGVFTKGHTFDNVVSALFTAGFAVAFLAFVLAPSMIHLILFGVYVIIYFIRSFMGGSGKKASRVIRSQTGEPVPFALVRIYAANDKREITRKIASYYGRFFCLVPNGNYFLTVETRNADGTYTLSYTSSVFTVTNGMIAKTLAI